jgi:hypothetical protein
MSKWFLKIKTFFLSLFDLIDTVTMRACGTVGWLYLLYRIIHGR